MNSDNIEASSGVFGLSTVKDSDTEGIEYFSRTYLRDVDDDDALLFKVAMAVGRIISQMQLLEQWTLTGDPGFDVRCLYQEGFETLMELCRKNLKELIPELETIPESEMRRLFPELIAKFGKGEGYNPTS